MATMPNGELVIHDGNAHTVMFPTVDGEERARGLSPRTWGAHPCGSIPGAPAAAIEKIPRSEWSARIADLVAKGALNSNIRDKGNAGQRIPSRDQNGKGYCHTADTQALTEQRSLPWSEYNYP